MRPIKQLLELTLECFKEWDIKGICRVIQVMDGDIITREEFHVLDKYIQKHRPKRGKFYDKNYREFLQFWDEEDKEIREQWMEYLIDNYR